MKCEYMFYDRELKRMVPCGAPSKLHGFGKCVKHETSVQLEVKGTYSRKKRLRAIPAGCRTKSAALCEEHFLFMQDAFLPLIWAQVGHYGGGIL